MTFFASDPVSSGMAYAVVTVGDSRPASLDEFVGEVTITIDRGTGQSLIAGQGSTEGDRIRFQEKDANHNGKDVRVWLITASDDGTFSAVSLSTY